MKTIQIKCGNQLFAVNADGQVAEIKRYGENPVWSRTLTFEGTNKSGGGYFDVVQCFEVPNQIMGGIPQIVGEGGKLIPLHPIEGINVPFYSEKISFITPEDEERARETAQAKQWIRKGRMKAIVDNCQFLDLEDILVSVIKGVKLDEKKVSDLRHGFDMFLTTKELP